MRHSLPDDGRSGREARATPSRFIAPWYLAYLILGLITSGMLPFLLPLMVANITDDFGRVAYIVVAYNAGLLPAPLLGRLAERYRLFRPVFFGGFAALCLGLSAAAMAMSLTAWVALAVLCGLGAGAVATVAPLFVFNFAPKSEWNARIGWLQSFSGAGQLAGLLLAGLILLALLVYGFWLGAVLSALAIVVGHLGLPSDGHDREKRLPPVAWGRLMGAFQSGPPLGGLLNHSHHLQGEALRRFLKSMDWEFGRFLLAWAAINFGVAPFFAYYPLIMNSTFGIAPATIAVIYAFAAAVGIAVFVAAGRAAQQFGSRSVFLLGLALRASGFGMLATVALVAPWSTPTGAILAFMLVVLAWPLLSVSATGLAASLTPVGKGAAMGLLASTNGIATVLGTALAGPLVQALGYAVVAPLALAGLLGAAALTATVRRGNGCDRAEAVAGTIRAAITERSIA